MPESLHCSHSDSSFAWLACCVRALCRRRSRTTVSACCPGGTELRRSLLYWLALRTCSHHCSIHCFIVSSVSKLLHATVSPTPFFFLFQSLSLRGSRAYGLHTRFHRSSLLFC